MTRTLLTIISLAILSPAHNGRSAPTDMRVPVSAFTQEDSAAALLTLQQRLDRIFTSGGYRPNGISAKVVSLRTGRVLYERNPDLPLTPASTTKLFTTAALHAYMGPEARLLTEARTDGTLTSDGTLNGNLYLVGCGDAMLTVGDIEDLADRVIASGVRRISGAVIGDGSRFDAVTNRAIYSGDHEDVEATGSITALNVQRGSIAFLVSASRSGIASVQAIPSSDAFTVESRVRVIAPRRRSPGRVRRGAPVNRGSAGRPAKRRRTSVRRNGDAPEPPRRVRHSVARIRVEQLPVAKSGQLRFVVTGSISVGSTATVYAQTPRPALLLAGVLSQRLRAGGVAVSTNVAEKPCPPGSARVAATGRPLLEFTSVINKRSDNFLAEHAFKMCGLQTGAAVSTAEVARRAIARAIDSLGVNRTGMTLNDGSGLSRRNVVSASTQVDLLRACDRQSWSSEWHSSLAIAGVDGSIRRRMIGTPAMQNVHAKTGTLRNVSSLSGYVSTRDAEPLAFSFISNGSSVSSYKAAEDAAAIALASFTWKPGQPLIISPAPTKRDSLQDKVKSDRP
ncbi:MAG: D-alanyl-D-alanine carboxypeptidase/D-alanyl-D-alanine-endopeptidase [Candidatus Kapabacteria bacterium]|nr:D-alanyl-D-alanine carboxypeptidase/D-alanyl-D-alanine-endopeptidase [Candidatus Kapabacteria bacterium]